MQEQLWFLDRLAPGIPFNNVPVALELGPDLEVAVAAAALNELRRRHEALRTTFREEVGELVQVVHDPQPRPLPVVDLRSLPGVRERAETRRLEAAEGRRPFDLEAGPLLRAVLLRLAQGNRLLLTQHHIVTDGRSCRILCRELSALCSDLGRGRRPSPAEPPVRYADYAVWQRRRLRGEVLDELLRFWRKELGRHPPVLDLYTDRPRPVRPRFRGGERRFQVPAEVCAALRALARRPGAAPAAVLLAALQTLLGRLCGRRRLLVGCAFAGRRHRELNGVIGCFATVLPVAGDLRRDPSFQELAAGAQARLLAVRAHQDLPLSRLAAELDLDREPDRLPLVQVGISYLGNLLSGFRWVKVPFTYVDLELHVTTTGEALTADLVYDRDLFDATTVERLGRGFQRLLAAAVREPRRRLSQLPVLSAGERQAVLCEWSAGPLRAAESGRAPCLLPELFERQASARPDSTAVAGGRDRVSYGELARRTSRLASRLRRQGVGPEVAVGVLAGASCERVESFLAVLEAGGVYVPLDPAYPEARLRFMVEEARIPVVLGRGARARSLAAGGTRPLDPRAQRPSAENLAYVIYTSGSTGRPKAVAATHGGLANLCRTVSRLFSSRSRVLQASSPGFDASIWELAGALTTGACLYLALPEDLMPGPALARFLERRRITAAALTPSALAALDRASLPELETLVVAGESCSLRLAREWSPGRAFYNSYGPAETSVCATLGRWTGGDRVPIGPAIAGARVYVLDRRLRPLPPGAPGELAIAGRGVSRGYLGRPAATAELFVPDPLGASGGGRLYRSGDRARFLADGRLEFLGRSDRQVKIRGVRIELGEIEAALAEHPRLRGAVVTAPEEEDPGRRRIVAYVVPRDGGAAAAARLDAELRSHLGRRLPRSMVPARFVTLAALPLTANGKVDVRALPPPPARTPAAGKPRTELEEVLASIWEEVLGLESVGREEDFFALGGHSLNAVRILARARQDLGLELPVRALFDHPTVASLARHAETSFGAAAAAPPILPRRPSAAPPPLSFAQQRLWLLDRLFPGGSFYNVPLVLRLTGALDAAALGAALGAVVRRHDTLRTTFAEVAGEPVQHVHAPPPPVLPAVDLRRLGTERRRAEARRLARSAADRPFDLERGPLFSRTLVVLGAAEHHLLLTLHHIVADGWSIGVLCRELAALYDGRRGREAETLPALPIRYADYAVWQREWLTGEALERRLDYWRKKVGPNPPPLQLATDRPRGARQALRGARLPAELPAGPAGGLRSLARDGGATLAMTLLAAFEVLLCRLTGRSAVLVGTPVAGRTRAELEPLIGMFVNPLVMAGDLTGRPSFRELLGRVRREALESYAHQDLPFEKLVEELGLDRDLSRHPLFQVVFALQNAPMEAPRFAGLGAELLPIEAHSTRFDVELHLWETAQGLGGLCCYDADLFDETTVRRLLGHFRVLLESAVAAPGAAAADLPWLSPAGRHQMAAEWNDTRGARGGRSLAERFAHRERLQPDAVAVVCGERALSFADLGRRARRLARRLRRRGVGAEAPVGLAVARSPELVTGLLGVLMAGGCYVPLDLDHPDERLRTVLRDAGVLLVLAAGAAGQRFRGLCRAAGADGRDVDLLVLDAGAGGPAAPPVPETGNAAGGPAQLAYVFHTSGSTGSPRGIGVPQRGVERLVCDTDFVRLGPADRVAQVTHAGFDVATFEIWGALLNGAALEILERETILDPRRFSAALRERRISTLFLTPALFHQTARDAPDAFGGLTHLLLGGDVVPPRWVAEVMRRGAPRRVLNAYGPTENTTFTTWHRVSSPPEAAAVPIGRPVAGTTVYVLDRRLRPLPIGVAGELATGGDGVARGYQRRAGRTAESFVPDPFGDRPGGRLYRTRDLARRRRDGAMDFLGRLDRQVKIRGFRVEPGEVEAALAGDPRVGEAVVVVAGPDDAERRLAAFVVPRQAAPPAADLEAELRRALSRRLPAYMVPSGVAVLEALPLTPNGKVDRAALGRRALAPRRETAANEAAPRSPVEELLAAIWEEVLGGGRVGLEEDFFALGGHSLSAVRVVARVRELLRVDLPPRAIFEHPTVSALARRIEASRESEALPAVARRPRGRGPWPLSFAQERLWFLDRLVPGNPFYNIPHFLRFRGRLRIPALARALAEIVRRHEALRSTFGTAAGRPVQEVHPPASPGGGARLLPTVDLGRLGAGRREAEARRLASAEAARPFSLARGPLLRPLILALAPEDHVLGLVFHHIVADGWSLGVFHRELTELYRSLCRGAPPPLPELAVQYADFVLWQRQWLRGEVLGRQLAYWKRTIGEDDRAALDLPADRPRRTPGSMRGGAMAFELPPRLSADLRSLARRQGVTLAMTMLSAFYALLSRTADRTRIPVGSPVAGRTRSEVEGLIGFFANSLVLIGDLARDPSFRELLARVREVTLEAYAHQDLPFEKLVEELEPGRDLSRNPLFQVVFVFHNAPAELPGLPGLAVDRFDFEVRSTRFDLELYLVEAGARLSGFCAYDRDLFDAATAGRLAGHYRNLVEGAVASPSTAVSLLPLFGAGERHQLLHEWSVAAASPRGVPGPRSVAEIVRLQADRTPESVALVGGERHLSYRRLVRWARGVARLLGSRGVGPEVPVGVAAERAPETLVGVLGVLMAGGAYVPLDPSHPAERLRFMVADAGIRVVLGSRLPAPGRGPWGPAAFVPVEDRETSGLALPEAPPPRPADGANLAYVIFTSGSTGRPKGVAMHHAPLVNLLAWQRRSSRGGRTLQFAALSFDVSFQETFSTWSDGGTLVLVSQEDRLDPRRLSRVLGRQRIERLFLPSAALQHLAAAAVDPPAGLREVIVAGERLRLGAEARGFLARLRGGRLFNHYGPSETHLVVSWEADAGGRLPELPPIGRPIAGIRVLLLGRDLRPVPAGSPGELCVSGEALARGYLDRAAPTAERWLPDPLGTPPGGRLYRTGDRVRHRADGELEFLGRLDGQVKVRGQRLELGEIETTLAEQAAVREAAVFCREVAGAARLWACVVPRGRPAPGLAAELRAALARRLPAVMVPAGLVVLEAFPRTASGKVDRRALARDTAARALSRTELETAFVAPRTELEEAVSRVWLQVLGLESVGVHDNFFEVGGHSLALVRVQEDLRRSLERELSLVDLFRYPTIHALAGHLTGTLAAPVSHAQAERGGEKRFRGRARLASRRARRGRPAAEGR